MSLSTGVSCFEHPRDKTSIVAPVKENSKSFFNEKLICCLNPIPDHLLRRTLCLRLSPTPAVHRFRCPASPRFVASDNRHYRKLLVMSLSTHKVPRMGRWYFHRPTKLVQHGSRQLSSHFPKLVRFQGWPLPDTSVARSIRCCDVRSERGERVQLRRCHLCAAITDSCLSPVVEVQHEFICHDCEWWEQPYLLKSRHRESLQRFFQALQNRIAFVLPLH